MIDKADVLICGGGIIGLTLARELLGKGCENIVILEKEPDIGLHASGRNSGVLHAGIYYAEDSFKAKFCLQGNILMKEFCRQRGITVQETGKVIVSRHEGEIPALRELHRRARLNGAKADLIDEKQLKDREPYAKTCGVALYSHDTAVVDPKRVLEKIAGEILGTGKVTILRGTEITGLRQGRRVATNRGEVSFDLFINAAGSFSDRIAHMFGVGRNYRLVPFKGTYRKLKKEKSYLVKGNIYPVPDVRTPFLGVHFTRTSDGTVFIGPTAIPAFGRENYGLLRGTDREVFQFIYRDLVLFFRNRQFREVALTEPKKYVKRLFFEDAKDLVHGLGLKDLDESSKSGIRPQLVDWEKKELVSDFIVLKERNSIHILNTVSPGFTSSMAFAGFIVNNYV